MSLETGIVDQLKAESIVPENVPENVQSRDEMLQIAKASFSMQFNSDKLVSFLGTACTQENGKWQFHVPGISIDFTYEFDRNEYLFRIFHLQPNISARLHDPIFLPIARFCSH